MVNYLYASEIEDKEIIRRLIEKALEISIKKITGSKIMHGIFLLEDLIPLYRCERARLYIGFSTRVNLKEKDEAVIEFTPQVYVRENVLDYVNLRGEIGASANAITRSQDNRFMETLEEDQFDKRYNLKPREKNIKASSKIIPIVLS